MAVNSNCRLYFMIVCSLNMSYVKIKVKASEMLVSPCLGWPEAHSKGTLLWFRRCPLKNICISVESGRSWSRIWERRIMRKERNKWVTRSLPSFAWSTFQCWKGEIQLITEEQLGPLDGLFSQVTWTTFKGISSEQFAQGLHGWPWKGVSFLCWKCSSWYWRM